MKYRNICRVFALMLTLVIVLLALSACGAKSCGGDGIDPLDGGTSEVDGSQNGSGSSSDGTSDTSDGTTLPKQPQPYDDPDLLEPI